MVMIKWMLLMAAIGGTCSLKAQFNDSTHYYVKYATTGIVNRTNDARSFVLNNALNFQVSKQKLALYSSNTWVYGRQGSNLTNNDFATAFNADYGRKVQKLYYWALASFTASYSLKINYQVQAGAGIGYHFIKKDHAGLELSDGPLYETSDLELANDVHERYQTVRNSLRLKYHWYINNLVKWEGMHFWQPSLEAIDDYILRSTNSLSIKLRSWLSLSTALTYNRLSRTNRENLLVTFGLTAEKYF